MEEKIKRPLKKSDLNFIYFFNKENQEEKWLVTLIKDEFVRGNFLNYVNFDFVNVGIKTFKLDKFVKSEKFKKANIIFAEENYMNLIGKENLVDKEVNVLDRTSFEVAEKLAGTDNSFDYAVFYKIKEYIDNYYGKVKYFSIANKETCKIRIFDNVEATCIMKLEDRCFTEYNKDVFTEVCKNTLENAIDNEKMNIERLEIVLKNAKKNLEVLKNRLGQIDSEIEKL